MRSPRQEVVASDARRTPPPAHDLRRGATSRRRLIADRSARWLVTAGGLAIIAGILGILLFILVEVWPLTASAEVGEARRLDLAGAPAGAAVLDEHRSHAVVLSTDGVARVFRLRDGALIATRPLAEEVELRGTLAATSGQSLLAGATADGHVVAYQVDWDVSFAGQERVTTPNLSEPIRFELDPTRGPLGAYAVVMDASGTATAAAQLASGALAVARRGVEVNAITTATTESRLLFQSDSPALLSHLAIDVEQQTVYGATVEGRLVWWDLREGEPGPAHVVLEATGGPITALSLLIGGRSLVVGRADGRLEIWFKVRQPDESFRLALIRQLAKQAGAVRSIAPSARDRSFLALGEQGELALYHSTSERVLWRGRVPLPQATVVSFAPKGDAALVVEPGRFSLLAIHNPHPEISLKALFGRVWYEGYERPQYVWQSTGGSDDFEPKLSLVPLMLGTLKGTLYSLVLAIPLAVLAAMYTSQFMKPGLRGAVKPTVEIMASLPSVVLGFLAGLWLAPRVERIVPGLLLMIPALPALVLVVWALMRALPRRVRGRLSSGIEIVPYALVLALGVWACLQLSGPLEALAFDGTFQEWLLQTAGLRHDQRNALVVGLAMGFAVIPIIFAISEDAFSNVPRNLVSGSLALGADRWQTVTRLVLPSASPGIFSAIMIGFGRAVGETMIVLMATGNTPLLDWNPFTGFRTLSANIAVEIPEASHGGTLYRTLFLSALILFAFTFIVNTAAESVRQRLRRRYTEL